MSCESVLRNSELTFDSKLINGEFRKDSRISYSRDSLLSLAGVNISKELPSGFDRSILSELDDVCNSAPEHQKPAGYEFAERWDSCKLTSKDSLNSACKSALEHQKLPSHWLSGVTSDDSNQKSSEKWGSCKFSAKDSKTIDSGNSSSNQAQRSWQKPGNTGILGSLQNPERSSILGSWSGIKLASAGSEGSTFKLPATDSLLSRCNEPYRPPSFYKAMNHSGPQNHDSFSKETSGCAELPSKERALEESWRKGLDEHSITPLTSKNSTSPTVPAVSGPVEHPCPSEEASGKCVTEESPVQRPLVLEPVVQQLPSMSQVIKTNSGAVIVDVENLHGPILEGGRFSALINLEEMEDIDAYFLDEENFASSDSSSNGQNVKDVNLGMGFEILENKELKSHAGYPAKSQVAKIDDILQVDTKVKPASVASASAAAQDWKGTGTAAKESHKANSPMTLGPHQSEVRGKRTDSAIPEIWQSSRGNKYHGDVVDGIGSQGRCRSGSRFVHWFPENDKSDCDTLSETEEDGWIVWGASIGKSVKESLLDQGKPKIASTCAQKAPSDEKTKSSVSDSRDSHNAVKNNFYHDGIGYLDITAGNQELHHVPEVNSGFQIAEEADSSLELNLPDEDSLITIDDTYILLEDEPKPYPEMAFNGGKGISHFTGSDELIRSESVQQNLRSQNPRFYDSQRNSWNLLVNPSDSLARVNTPPTLNDPWKTRHIDHNPFAVYPPLSGMHPLKSHNHDPSVEQFLSPRTSQADDYCPDLDKILSADPSTYHQFFQTPCSSPEPNVLRSLPLNHPNNVKTTMDMRKNGFLAEERNMSTISQYLQMQRNLAQMKIDAVEQRAYGRAANKLIW